MALALFLRVLAISLYPLANDEYASIREATAVGLNWNSIGYSILMHFWVRLGATELWLRLPAAMFGVATVPIIFKTAEKLGGARAASIAGLLAAVSPFNIYHSQEVRFYSLFMFCGAAFMLATVSYVDSRRVARDRLMVLVTGLILLLSHFLGLLALCAQGAATLAAVHWHKRLRTVLAFSLGLPLLILGLPLIPFVRDTLGHLYRVYGNAPNADLFGSRLALTNLAKLAFAGYTFVFGYHVYPLRLFVVIPGLLLTGFLLVFGVRKLWQRPEWRLLPVSYLLVLIGIYTILDSIGGRVASGVSPRHAAFVWPAFVLFVALGLSSLRKRNFQVLLAGFLLVNTISLWYGWRKDWTYGVATDYRSAASYLANWTNPNVALIGDGRSQEVVDFYFPRTMPRINPWPASEALRKAVTFRHVIVVTNNWRAENRRESEALLQLLDSRFSWIDGRVDYPMFEYVLERKLSSGDTGYSLIPETRQLRQPLSFYGGEFQDLRLPITATVGGVQLRVVGAYALPNSEGNSTVTIPLDQPTHAGKLILLTNAVGLTQPGETIAEIIVEDNSGAAYLFPLRLGRETASWSDPCPAQAECQTVFQWHKRIVMASENNSSDGWRDFQAGAHGVAFDLPPGAEVKTLKLRYLAGSGHLFIWGIALPAPISGD